MRSLSEVEPSRRTERSRWVSLSNPSNEWGGSSLFALRPLQHQPLLHQVATVCHAVLCFLCRPLFTMRPRFAMQASAYHATLGFLCKPLFAMRATVCQAAPGLPYSHRFTEYPSAYHAGHGLPCDARFPLQAAVYHVAICLPYTPLLTAPPLQALPQHPAALPTLCITSHHTATSPLHHLKAYDVPACLL